MLSPYRTPSKRTTVLTAPAPTYRPPSRSSAPVPRAHGLEGGLHTNGACGRRELVDMWDDRLLERDGHRRAAKVGLWPRNARKRRMSGERAMGGPRPMQAQATDRVHARCSHFDSICFQQFVAVRQGQPLKACRQYPMHDNEILAKPSPRPLIRANPAPVL